MWPFKKVETLTVEEFAATFPPARCGEQTKHYEWIEIMGLPCPVCAAQKVKQQKEYDMDLLADKIAKRVLNVIEQ